MENLKKLIEKEALKEVENSLVQFTASPELVEFLKEEWIEYTSRKFMDFINGKGGDELHYYEKSLMGNLVQKILEPKFLSKYSTPNHSCYKSQRTFYHETARPDILRASRYCNDYPDNFWEVQWLIRGREVERIKAEGK